MKKNFRTKKLRSFTMIELMVSVMIVALMSAVAVISLNTARQSTTMTTGADEVKNLLEELKSYGVGPERSGASHYILIIRRNSEPPEPLSFCNQRLPNPNTNQLPGPNASDQYYYMICVATDRPDITNASLNDDFHRVRSGHFEFGFTITDPPGDPDGNIVFNVRTYDGQLGYNLSYIDTAIDPGVFPTAQTIKISKANFTKEIIVNLIINTIKVQ